MVKIDLTTGLLTALVAAILPEVAKVSPEIAEIIEPKADVITMRIPSSQFGRPDPRNGFNRDDTEYRVTLVNGHGVACTCYGYHYHGFCKHLAQAERLLRYGTGKQER